MLSSIKKFIKSALYDPINNRILELTAQKNVPVVLRDQNGREVSLEGNSSVPVTLQDQTTPPIIIYANKVTNTTTLSAATAIDDMIISVVSAVGINTGDYLGLFSTDTDRFYVGNVISINVDDLTMDTPLDSVFAISDTVGTGIRDLAVNGSVTPQTFTLRGADPGINLTGDITRFILQMTTTDPAEYPDFGDIAGGLTNGVVIRRVDGSVQNILNIKSNAEIANLAYDVSFLEQAKPSGVNGIVSRLTFAGQSKMGVVLRIGPGEDIEVIIQDDLSSLLSFSIVFEGSVAIV